MGEPGHQDLVTVPRRYLILTEEGLTLQRRQVGVKETQQVLQEQRSGHSSQRRQRLPEKL